MAPLRAILGGLTMAALTSALPRRIGWEPGPHDYEDIAVKGGLYDLETRRKPSMPHYGHPAPTFWDEPPEFPPIEPSVALSVSTTSMITEVYTSYLHLTTSPSFDKPTPTSVAVTTVTAPYVAIETSVEVKIESVLLTTSASASTLVSSSSSSATTPAFAMTSAPVTSAHPYGSCEDARKRVSSWYSALIYTDALGGLHKPPPSLGRVMPGECGPRKFSARSEPEASLALTMSDTKSDDGTHSGPHLGPVNLHHGKWLGSGKLVIVLCFSVLAPGLSLRLSPSSLSLIDDSSSSSSSSSSISHFISLECNQSIKNSRTQSNRAYGRGGKFNLDWKGAASRSSC